MLAVTGKNSKRNSDTSHAVTRGDRDALQGQSSKRVWVPLPVTIISLIQDQVLPFSGLEEYFETWENLGEFKPPQLTGILR